MEHIRANKQPVALPKSDTAKRPYAAPRLIVHGTMTELTASKLASQQLVSPGYATGA